MARQLYLISFLKKIFLVVLPLWVESHVALAVSVTPTCLPFSDRLPVYFGYPHRQNQPISLSLSLSSIISPLAISPHPDPPDCVPLFLSVSIHKHTRTYMKKCQSCKNIFRGAFVLLLVLMLHKKAVALQCLVFTELAIPSKCRCHN